MSGPPPVPLIPMPGWVADVQAALSGGPGEGAADLAALQGIANAVNPSASTINCGNIIDAAIDRFTGADPDAVALPGTDGFFEEIEARHDTTINWNSSFQDVFDAVSAGGDGTVAVVGIQYAGGNASHVVVLVNQGGTVGIIEGQDWGNDNPREVITTPDRANERYNAGGGSNVGFGIVGAGAPAP